MFISVDYEERIQRLKEDLATWLSPNDRLTLSYKELEEVLKR